MMRNTLLILVLGTMLGGVALACSDDEPTFEEYFREFQAIQEEMRLGLGDFAGFNPLTADAETRADFADALHNAVDDFEDLRSGSDFRESHSAYVRAMRQQADAIADADDDRLREAMRDENAAWCAIRRVAEREGLIEESVLKSCEGS